MTAVARRPVPFVRSQTDAFEGGIIGGLFVIPLRVFCLKVCVLPLPEDPSDSYPVGVSGRYPCSVEQRESLAIDDEVKRSQISSAVQTSVPCVEPIHRGVHIGPVTSGAKRLSTGAIGRSFAYVASSVRW